MLPPRPRVLLGLAALLAGGCAALRPAPHVDRPRSLVGCYRLDAPEAAGSPSWFRGTPGAVELTAVPVAGRDSTGRSVPSPYRAAYGRTDVRDWPRADDPFRAWRPTEAGDSLLIALGPARFAFGGVYVVARPERGGLVGRLVAYTDASATGEFQRSVPLQAPRVPCPAYRVGDSERGGR